MLMPRASARKGGSGRASFAGVRRSGSKGSAGAKEKPHLSKFVSKRDYTGALTLLEFERRAGEERAQALEWMGYCAFHLGDFERALEAYDELLRRGGEGGGGEGKAGAAAGVDEERIELYRALCLYFLRRYNEAEEAALRADKGDPSVVRVRFHIAHRQQDESRLMSLHAKLSNTKADQLCLAAVHYMRNHFQQATDIYKKLLLDNREDIALNVYVALCYYKLDYYDVSLEILAVYLQAVPDSAVAINLKACNHYRLYNGKSAEAEFKTLVDKGVDLSSHPLLQHNLVVFRGGSNALQVLPPLVDVIPEARLNLVVFFLRNGENEEAFKAMQDVEPSTPAEYILKAIVNANLAQATNNRDKLQVAQDMFQVVGASASECDTIPGRQSMASCFFLLRQFEDVNVYLNSIRTYLTSDDSFNWNYGTALAATGSFREALDCLLQVNNEEWRQQHEYLSWLARCHIMTGSPHLAWDVYQNLSGSSAKDSIHLLQLIANDCYRMGYFFYSAKAFDILERMDPDPEYMEGKRGACVGVFQTFIAAREGLEEATGKGATVITSNELGDCIDMLRTSTNPQVEYIIQVMRKWCDENAVAL